MSSHPRRIDWGLRDYSCPEIVFGGGAECEHEWGPERIVKRGHPGDQSTLVGTQTAQISKAAGRQGSFCQLCGAWRGQFGLEPTPEMYVDHTIEFLRAIRRVLRKDGTVWWNIGDSYARNPSRGIKFQAGPSTYLVNRQAIEQNRGPEVPEGLKEKDLVLIPSRVALAAQADGWWVRSVIIWHKPNPMPESVRDRPTTSHEYVLLLAKSKDYYYDADAIREPHKPASLRRAEYKGANGTKWHDSLQTRGGGPNDRACLAYGPNNNPSGRNKRTVWTISTKPYSGPHYATFPPDLIEPMILAGTSPKVCAECGAPWERVTEKSTALEPGRKHPGFGRVFSDERNLIKGGGEKSSTLHHVTENQTLGWHPTCDHDPTKTKPATVLDPFGGTGTVLEQCIKHGREGIIIDIDPKSIRLAEERTGKPIQRVLV